jgi:PqqA peptide cyclase
LRDIRPKSPAFTAFRGTGYLPEPCRSCGRREIDFGGCRCQAFALTGDAAATDPVCHLSPHHHLVEEEVWLRNGAMKRLRLRPSIAGSPLFDCVSRAFP